MVRIYPRFSVFTVVESIYTFLYGAKFNFDFFLLGVYVWSLPRCAEMETS